VPFGTDVTAVIATFATTGVSVSVGSAVQTSGISANDFTSPVEYTVAAEDGSTAVYTVTVTIAASSAKEITSFGLVTPAVTGVIAQDARTIAVFVPSGTDVTALVATFTTTGTRVSVDSTDQESGVTANDFTTPLEYVVTAADGSMVIYIVTVTIMPSNAKAITSFEFTSPVSVSGTIDEDAKTIAVTVPSATDVRQLIAAFRTSGVSVTVGGVEQVSGTTPNDFSAPVEYVVTAADGSMATYAVTVTIR
jgi:hypothetical protein